jgi:hypothetical protein
VIKVVMESQEARSVGKVPVIKCRGRRYNAASWTVAKAMGFEGSMVVRDECGRVGLVDWVWGRFSVGAGSREREKAEKGREKGQYLSKWERMPRKVGVR